MTRLHPFDVPWLPRYDPVRRAAALDPFGGCVFAMDADDRILDARGASVTAARMTHAHRPDGAPVNLGQLRTTPPRGTVALLLHVPQSVGCRWRRASGSRDVGDGVHALWSAPWNGGQEIAWVDWGQPDRLPFREGAAIWDGESRWRECVIRVGWRAHRSLPLRMEGADTPVSPWWSTHAGTEPGGMVWTTGWPAAAWRQRGQEHRQALRRDPLLARATAAWIRDTESPLGRVASVVDGVRRAVAVIQDRWPTVRPVAQVLAEHQGDRTDRIRVLAAALAVIGEATDPVWVGQAWDHPVLDACWGTAAVPSLLPAPALYARRHRIVLDPDSPDGLPREWRNRSAVRLVGGFDPEPLRIVMPPAG